MTAKSALLLAAALLLVTVVFAIDADLQTAIDFDAGLKQVREGELGMPLELAETIDNLTVKLQWAYADAERITVAYTIGGEGSLDSPAFNYASENVVLTDPAGDPFEGAGGIGYTGMGEDALFVMSFDTSKVEDLPDELDLTLSMNVQFMTADRWATIEAQPTPGPETTPEVSADREFPSPYEGSAGTFEFEFRVPVHASRVVEIDQSVTDQDVEITLERAVIAPSRTRLELCFEAPEERSGGWAVIPFLSIEGSSLMLENPPVAPGDDPIEGTNCRSLIYNAALGERPGEWELRITELVGFGDTGSDQVRVAGDWTFTFEVEAE